MAVKQSVVHLIIALVKYLVVRLIVKPIDFFLDTLQGHFSYAGPNKYLQGNFGPVQKEYTTHSLPIVHGSLPSDLAGEFVRNGPNPVLVPKGGYHWFDGDGMLHGVRITKDGKANYVNRYTKTQRLESELKTGLLITRIGELHGKLGLVKAIFMMLKRKLGLVYALGTANTSVVFHNKKLQALVESDLPYEIRILRDGQLETAGRMDYDGKMARMTAHPKVDPVTNELFFFSYNFDSAPWVRYGYVDPKGDVVREMPIDIPSPVMMHDFAITEHYVIFLDLCMTFDKNRIFTGSVIGYDPKHNARVGILDRYAKNSDGIVWFNVPPNAVFHTANAWEEGGEIVLATCKAMYGFDLDDPIGGMFGLAEWRFNLKTKEFKEHLILTEDFAEFPQIHPAFVGRKNKYVYCVTGPKRGEDKANISGLIKVDLETKQPIKTFTFGNNKVGGEGVFVPRENYSSEDDGYLLTFVYDPNTNSSSFWVIDAKSMSDVIAIVDLPQRVPYGFHGIFVSEKEIQSQL